MSRQRSWNIRFLSIQSVLRLGLLYLALVALIAGCQQSFIYFPRYEPRFDEQVKAVGWKEWTTPRGEFIGWIIERRKQNPFYAYIPGSDKGGEIPILMFHGNAGSASWRSHWVDAMQGVGFGEMRILEYPGYGRRKGRPSEATFIPSAVGAFDLWESERGHRQPKIVLLGESLGSGVAAAVAQARPERVGGVILAVPYDSILNVARSRLPFLPIGWLLRERYDSVSRLKGLNVPVVIVSAAQDEVIPVEHARRLRAALSENGVPHQYVELAHAQHNDLTSYREDWAPQAFEFIAKQRMD
ncbi:MAG: alpha/beta hydrolase [Verrucomicrobiae bacterium]|nr:alpha/beta hydrolase [Verrucomicrobiae bacterium]